MKMCLEPLLGGVTKHMQLTADSKEGNLNNTKNVLQCVFRSEKLLKCDYEGIVYVCNDCRFY